MTLRSFDSKQPQLGERVYIDPSATIIGDVILGNDSSVWPNASIRGDVNSIFIDEMTNVQDGAVLHVTHEGPYTGKGEKLFIGKGVTIGHKAVLHGCQIRDLSLIGINAIILDGVEVESYVLVAAGSLVPPGKHLKSGYLYLGNPAREVRILTKNEIKNLEYSAKHYIQLKNKYLRRHE
ncbi:gamma carbonic anhydrase family protein [Legionella israelensis]|uniref:Gamma carbonic anhydrase family protein n=1 Tax=Legionella israelensis TaxID=454 RepID=A0AAX1EI22_9GAMM|nr:gamma carbonic anhydrase family protein [Legionella israelensis]QBR84615.1 gamma carbonic anhydrase family protein [Legionella israelensis]